jgi:hypothetical protein
MDELSYLAFARTGDRPLREKLCVIAMADSRATRETYKITYLILCAARSGTSASGFLRKDAVDFCFGTREYLPTKSGCSKCFVKSRIPKAFGRIWAAATNCCATIARK